MWFNFSHSKALITAFRLTRNGVRAKSSVVGFFGPVNKISNTSSMSSRGGGRTEYIFGIGDSNAIILAFIFRIPDATLTYAQVCLTLAINIFSTYLKQLNSSGTFPIHKLFARAKRGIFPLRMQARHVSQI